MYDSKLPHALEGHLREIPSDLLFWVASVCTFVVAYFLQRSGKQNASWTHVLAQIFPTEEGKTSNWTPQIFAILTLLTTALLVSSEVDHDTLLPNYHGPWYLLLAFPVLVLGSQFILHTFFGLIWEDHKQHWQHWSHRFRYLPFIWLSLPLLLWTIAAFKSDTFLYESFFFGLVFLCATLYAIGVFRAGYQFLNNSNTPWYMAFLYLCTLEASPIFWILLFQSYEG